MSGPQWLLSQQVLLLRGVTEPQCKDTQRYDTFVRRQNALHSEARKADCHLTVMAKKIYLRSDTECSLCKTQLKCLRSSITSMRDAWRRSAVLPF